uniref:C5a anaphylatoxin chemotactic receptor 1 n=1 Tax=Salvator merianae TaxID=96440 RepID=A0A8D0B6R8_SALMN
MGNDSVGFNDSYDYENYSSVPMIILATDRLSPVIWVALVLYALVFLVGVLGNGAVIWVMLFQMRRTVNTAWFLNLAVADFLCCVAVPFIATPLPVDHEWKLGDFACKLFPSLIILNMFASILLLVLISVDRCALVLRPVWCQNYRSVCLAWKLCGAAWTTSLLLTLPSFIFRKAVQPHNSSKTLCGVDYSAVGENHRGAEVSVAAARFVLAFAVPFAVISCCYGLLLRHVHRSRLTRSNKAFKVVLTVVVSFFVCWAPYHVAGLILASEPRSSPLFKAVNSADPLIVALAYFNSCINPIIYVVAGQGFQAKMQRSLRALLQNILSEEMLGRRSQVPDGHATQATCSTMEDRSNSATV